MNYRHYIKYILFSIILIALMSACQNDNSPSSENKDEQSGGEDTLIIYNGQHKDATVALIDAFTEETGIQVKSREGSSNELAHQIVEEGERSPADIIYTEEIAPLVMLKEKDLLEKIDENALQPIPSGYKDEEGKWTGLLARSRVVAYNTSMITEEEMPDSVLDFAKEEWDGRVAFVSTSGAFQQQLSALIKLEGKETAKAWLEGLKEYGKIYKKNSIALKAVEDGEIDLALINNYYWDREAAEHGEENMNSKLYFFGTGDIGDMLTVAGTSILQSSNLKEEAQQFVEFATSKQGQQILTDISKQYPLNEEAETAGLKPFKELTPPNGTLDLGEYSNGEAAIELLEEVGLF